MNYIKINSCDIANGLGVRVVLWVSGCDHNCLGCHNPETHDYNLGKKLDKSAEAYLFECLDKPWVRGITFSGGDPMSPRNKATVLSICDSIRQRYGDTKDIWIYTGNLFNESDYMIYKDDGEVIAADVVVDGPFIQELRDISLPFRGSSNQRLIDVKKSVKSGKIVIYNVD